MERSKKTLAVVLLALTMVLGLTALTGCGGSSDDTATPASGQEAQSGAGDESTNGAEDEATYQDGMPITLTASGKDYLVESYDVTTDEDGNTVVTLYGPDFTMGSDWRDDMDAYLCFSADCEAGGQTYSSIIVGVQNMTSYQFTFEGSITPDSLTVYPKDDPGSTTTIQLEG